MERGRDPILSKGGERISLGDNDVKRGTTVLLCGRGIIVEHADIERGPDSKKGVLQRLRGAGPFVGVPLQQIVPDGWGVTGNGMWWIPNVWGSGVSPIVRDEHHPGILIFHEKGKRLSKRQPTPT